MKYITKDERERKRPSVRRRARDESGPQAAESGRLQHGEHQRSEEPGHQPHRGEVSTGQEP